MLEHEMQNLAEQAENTRLDSLSDFLRKTVPHSDLQRDGEVLKVIGDAAFHKTLETRLEEIYSTLLQNVSLKNITKNDATRYGLTAELIEPIDGVTKINIYLTKDY